jgi:hypothetical protein
MPEAVRKKSAIGKRKGPASKSRPLVFGEEMRLEGVLQADAGPDLVVRVDGVLEAELVVDGRGEDEVAVGAEDEVRGRPDDGIGQAGLHVVAEGSAAGPPGPLSARGEPGL